MVAKGKSSNTELQVLHVEPSWKPTDPFAEAIRVFNWGDTPLGVLAKWPPSLRHAVDIMLASPFPAALVWGDSMTVIHNAAYADVTGTAAPGLGSSFEQMWRKHWAQVGPSVFKALEGQASFVGDAPILVAADTEAGNVWSALGYTPIRDEQARVAGFLHTVINATASVATLGEWRDLTERFEQRIAEYQADRERIWALSSEAMIMVTLDLRLHAVNPAFERMLGWSLAQMVGMTITDLLHPSDRRDVAEVALDVLHGPGVRELESRVRHNAGHYCWIRWSARRDGRFLTAVGSDINQERENAMRRSEALLRNNQRVTVVSQLAGGVAHEMNNLLSGIGGSLELLQRRIDQGQPERIASYVELARGSVERAMSLTHQLLAFSSGQHLSPRPLNSTPAMMACGQLLLQALGPEMLLEWHLDNDAWPILVDPGQLENALVNLCTNAREACNFAGTVTIRSFNQRLEDDERALGGLEAGDYLAIQVEDNGQGIASEDIPRVFEPFFTSKPAGRGAGLGLPMVYGFVHQSGGHVWLESTLEQGTRVTMMFPRCLQVVEPLATPLPPVLMEPANGRRLLLIDDENGLRKLMKEALLEQGFEVVDVADATGAMSKFRHDGSFDLVVTDIGLPGGSSGRQVAQAMRLLKPQQKILFITGYSEHPIEQALLDQPGTGLMLKPFSLARLVAQVQSMLVEAG
ncbi:ATP-binding protein [Pseudomonas shirazensis]|uniref:hybrid sensor histidine kinase/response regulator n=1 Tax=Pseudomonas shirazensis TaxID=2745494 RepID=UPI003D29C427